jgi:hypothetical protein
VLVTSALMAFNATAAEYPECSVRAISPGFAPSTYRQLRAVGQWVVAIPRIVARPLAVRNAPVPKFDLYVGVMAPDGVARFWVESLSTGSQVALVAAPLPLAENLEDSGIFDHDAPNTLNKAPFNQRPIGLRLDLEPNTPLGLYELFCVVMPAGVPLHSTAPNRWPNSSANWLMLVDRL